MSLYIENVSYEVPRQTQSRILHNIDLSIEAGTITLIAGRTGSGKSTLLNIMAGLKAPVEGQVYYETKPLWQKRTPLGSLMERIGLVFQYPEHQFFLPTVREELLYSLKSSRLSSSQKELRIKETTGLCGLADEFLERAPFFLSGGEKRKTALASVLVAEPSWLLLDEPSSGLDSKVTLWLLKQLETLKAERICQGGIIIVTHDLDLFLPIADSVVLLNEGKLLGKFTPGELARNPQLLEMAGISVPSCLKLAMNLANPVLCIQEATPFSLKAEDIADRLYESISRGNSLGPIVPWKPAVKGESMEPMPSTEENLAVDLDPNPFVRLDPRSKWLFYVLFSVTVFLQPSWPVVIISMFIVMILAKITKIPITKLFKPLFPMALFMLFSFAVSGLQLYVSLSPFSLAGTGFSWPDAMETLERLAPLLPVMAGGAVFANSTSPIAMKKGLESLLMHIPGFGKGAETIALAASLMFRFLRLIPTEIERFAFLASLRGNRGGKPGKLRIHQLPGFFTPLLLSILQHAEDMSTSMEARGYGKTGKKRTNPAPLKWKNTDWAVCLAAIVIGGLFLFIGQRWG